MAYTLFARNALRRCISTAPARTIPQPRTLLASQSNRIAVPGNKRLFSYTRAAFVKKYTNDHEWIELEEGGETATIGISTYAADALGDVVYIELPAKDLEFGPGDTIGAVESVKSASDILAPVAGTVVEVNEALGDAPGEINRSPEAGSWLARIKVADKKEVDALMDGESYKAFTESAKSE